jgi:hypothetical protein
VQDPDLLFTIAGNIIEPFTDVTDFIDTNVVVPFTNTATATFSWYPCEDWETGGCDLLSIEEMDSASITVAQSQIPEPTTFALLCIGLAGLCFARMRAKA